MGGIIPECIIDANVIFDAIAGAILSEIFELGYYIITTDFVISEIESIPHSELITFGLVIKDMPASLLARC